MKKLLFLLGFVGLFQIASAQDASTAEAKTAYVKITLSESSGEQAKLLKKLKYGDLFKGVSKTIFLIKTSDKKTNKLKEELTELFPGCKLEFVIENK
jgi:hypothetical protein